MKGKQILAILLIVAGILALLYGGFSYTQETHEASLGPLEVEVQEKGRVNIPVWAGIGLVGAGVVLLLVGRR